MKIESMGSIIQTMLELRTVQVDFFIMKVLYIIESYWPLS
jgi:hypothetical protein